MKSQRAEHEAAQAATRPRIEAKLFIAGGIHQPDAQGWVEVTLAAYLNNGWQIQTCAADASGCNLVYTLIRSVVPEPVAPSGIPVR